VDHREIRRQRATGDQDMAIGLHDAPAGVAGEIRLMRSDHLGQTFRIELPERKVLKNVARDLSGAQGRFALRIRHLVIVGDEPVAKRQHQGNQHRDDGRARLHHASQQQAVLAEAALNGVDHGGAARPPFARRMARPCSERRNAMKRSRASDVRDGVTR